VFEMAARIQSPAKCSVRSVIRFLNAKCERRAEIQKQIVAVCGNVMNRQNLVLSGGFVYYTEDGDSMLLRNVFGTCLSKYLLPLPCRQKFSFSPTRELHLSQD
jgi:hypothetical protein